VVAVMAPGRRAPVAAAVRPVAAAPPSSCARRSREHRQRRFRCLRFSSRFKTGAWEPLSRSTMRRTEPAQVKGANASASAR
jgi:hypothetical protein